MTAPTILVIGAGVGGAACSLQLRRHGLNVCLVDKTVFPRSKVCGCCIGGTGLATLRELELDQWALAGGVVTSRWHGSMGGRVVELPLPRGIAISRQTLDTRLVEAARDAGVQVRMACKATIEDSSDNSVLANLIIDGIADRVKFDAVVVATGLSWSGQGLLPWKELPNGPFGAAYTATCDAIQPGVIYMVCDDDGYVGLVQLENGRVDIAAALTSGGAAASLGSPRDRIEAILGRSQFSSWRFRDRSDLMSTPSLRRTRVAGRGRVLAIGDAAGYVEPFTGEGMTWAMQSGLAAADLIHESAGDLSQVGGDWVRRLGGLLGRKKLACRAVTGALRSSTARRVAAVALSSYPSLAAPLIRSLNRGASTT